MNMPQKPDTNDDPITRPAHDEWGVYDPEQAGFEAILKKLSTKKKAVPDQARPVQAPAPGNDDDNSGIWMTPSKPGPK